MKKIIFTIITFFMLNNIYALENIKINNETLSPLFDSNIRIYNYYTDKDIIIIKVESSKNEEVKGYGIYNITKKQEQFKIESSKYGTYIINVFKNYQNEEDIRLLNLTIENYEINYSENKYEYYIDIENETNLNINYELSNDKSYVSIEGNGNFNKSDNIITINVNNQKKYIIHARKSLNVSKLENDNKEIKEFSQTKKEILKLIIIIIYSTIIFLFVKVLKNF